MNCEGISTEYKSGFVEDIKKTVIAFANTLGGQIGVGIGDDGTIIGIEDPDEILLKITNTIRDTIKPDVTPFTVCDKEIIDNKTIVTITVQKGTGCPYYLGNKGLRPEGVFVRQGASTVPATETAILKMIKETSGDNYEEMRSLSQTLSFDILEKELEEASLGLDRYRMKSLGLMREDELYTNLGLLLSDQCSHSIKAAIFQGTTKEIFKDRYEFSGSLFKQLRECFGFIDRYNSTRSQVEGLTRVDKRSYPVSAIREALLNAIVHRDYGYSGSTLVSIFDDRIEFVTLGGLPKGIAKEDMLLGVSMLRNRLLANIFYRLRLIEAFGTGIPKIMESYEGYPYVPKIEITENAFKITLYNQLNGNNQVHESPSSYLTEGEERLLAHFTKGQIVRRKDVEVILGISQPMAVKYLKKLLDKGIIHKLGNGKNICYRID